MSKLKGLVVFIMLPFVAFMWLVGWCMSWAGTKKLNLKTKGALKTRNSSKSIELTPTAIMLDTYA